MKWNADQKQTQSVFIFLLIPFEKTRHFDTVMTYFRVSNCHRRTVKSVDRKSESYIVDCIHLVILIPLVESSAPFDASFLDEMSVVHLSGNSQSSVTVSGESFDLEKQEHYAGYVETLWPERLQRKHSFRL